VDDSSPIAAIETALKRVSTRPLTLADFGDQVRVEVISTVEHSFSLSEVAQRFKTSEAQSRVA